MKKCSRKENNEMATFGWIRFCKPWKLIKVVEFKLLIYITGLYFLLHIFKLLFYSYLIYFSLYRSFGFSIS